MDFIRQLIERHPALASEEAAIRKACEMLIRCFENKGKLLAAGNGGSAADADHIVGELMKGFVKKRRISRELAGKIEGLDPVKGGGLASQLQTGLPAIALSAHAALNTASINDIDGTIIYAQQILGYGNPGDVFLGISTSGNAKNVYNGMIVAKAKGLATIALTGGSGGIIAGIADLSIIAPEQETYKIQECHLPIYHAICLTVEEYFFP